MPSTLGDHTGAPGITDQTGLGHSRASPLLLPPRKPRTPIFNP